MPVWSRDGQYLVFSSLLAGKNGVFRCRADGTGIEERLVDDTVMGVSSISPDGNSLALVSNSLDKTSIALLCLDGAERLPKPYLQSAFVNEDADFSPDGQRFFAFRRVPQPPQPPITHLNFVEHRFEELKAKVPARR